MMRHLVHTLALLALATSFLACSDDSCQDNGSSLPLVTLYMGGTQQPIAGLTIMGIDAPGDSVLEKSSTVKEVYLPLRATTGTTSYAMRRVVTTTSGQSTIDDTLTLTYDPIEYFHSMECGVMYNFSIKSVTCTTHGIDSIALLSQLVTNSRTPVMRIYFTDFQQ